MDPAGPHVHVALRVAYDGTRFRGLARQPEGNTVEDALITALRPEGLVDGSLRSGSRTDAGVSAVENVLAVQLQRPHARGLIPAVQARLPDGVWLTGVAPIEDSWNPRHAVLRTYHYLAPRGAEALDLMVAACDAFVGTHDFTAFARLEQRSPVRPVVAFDVAAEGAFWRFTIEAPGFLWNQVRRMVDACTAVGAGRATAADIGSSLRSGVAHNAFGLAPAEGLVLAKVRFEPALEWLDAGAIPPAKIAKARQEAYIRARVADALSALS